MKADKSLIARRDLIGFAAASLVLLAVPRKAHANSLAFVPTNDMVDSSESLIYDCSYFKAYRINGDLVIAYPDGSSYRCHVSSDYSSMVVELQDGSIIEYHLDETGCLFANGEPVGEVLYRRGPGDIQPRGCVLMSTTKKTVQEAADPSLLALELLGHIPTYGPIFDVIRDIAEKRTEANKDLYVIIKHWYCDGPKPITRKEFYLYEDKACTKFIKTWSVEAPVGVQ